MTVTFEKAVRIPRDRVAVLIGRRGSTKSRIERRCRVTLRINSETGDVWISSANDTPATTDGSVNGPGSTSGGDRSTNDGSRNISAVHDKYDVQFAPLKAPEIVVAIGRGFAPDVAMTLLNGDNALYVINLTEFAGKSRSGIERIKGRVIGERGRARRNMEQLSGTRISVYGKTVSVIGAGDRLRRAVDAINSMSGGSMHGTVYGKLEAANRRQKQERMILWEDSGGIIGGNSGVTP